MPDQVSAPTANADSGGGWSWAGQPPIRSNEIGKTQKLMDITAALFGENARLLSVLGKIEKVATKQEAEMAKAKGSTLTIDEIIEHIRGLNIYVVGPHEEIRDAIIKSLEEMRDEEQPEAEAGEEPAKRTAKARA